MSRLLLALALPLAACASSVRTTAVSVLLAPAAHRFLHRFHLDVYDEATATPPAP